MGTNARPTVLGCLIIHRRQLAVRITFACGRPSIAAPSPPEEKRALPLSQCVVVDCAQEGVVIAGKPTSWGAWEYWVCAAHKAEVDAGADIHDNPDGRTITLDPPQAVAGDTHGASITGGPVGDAAASR